MKTNFELIVKPSEFGIEESRTKELLGNLPDIISERKPLEIQYQDIIRRDIEDIETSKLARELRLRIRDNRTKGLKIWHKKNKEVFLRAGQFIDALKNKEEEVNLRMENNLEEIEKYREIQEQKKKEKIRDGRVLKLNPYTEFVPVGIDLLNMSDDDFEKVLNGAKIQLEAKKAKEEEERLLEEERVRLDKLENDRKLEIAQYRQFITKDIDLRNISIEEYQILVEECINAKKEYDDKQAQILAEKKRLEEENLKIQLEAKKAKEEANKKLAEEKEQRERELKAEREKQKKLEEILEQKKLAEEKLERERLEKIEANLKKGDSDKIKDLIHDLTDLKTKYTFNSKQYSHLYSQVQHNIQIIINNIKTYNINER
jgi:hypothetical protein